MSESDGYENEDPHIAELHREEFDGGFHVDGYFSNRWRFEMKSLDGQTYYNLHVPINELDRYEDGAQVDDWSFIPTEEVLEDLQSSIKNIDRFSDLKDEADTIPIKEYGSIFESLERESHV